MRLIKSNLVRSASLLKATMFATLLAATTVAPMMSPITTRAVSDCSPNGIAYAASGWLNGLGVNVCNHPGDNSNNYVNNVNGTSTLTGTKWQCVELVNRLYLTRGWTTGFWTGNGNTLVDHIPSGLTKQNNGSISYINPGDVVTLDDGGFGHAGIIDTNSGTTYNTINQNSSSLNSSVYIDSGSLGGGNAFLKKSGSTTYIVQAIIHAPSGGGGLPGGSETIGIYDPAGGVFHERNSNTPGPADLAVTYGNPNWIPLAGDWNNDKVFTPGAYDPSTGWFYLSNSNVPGGPPDTPAFNYGNIGWTPIVGDWDGNGYWSIGMYDPGTGIFYLRNTNSPGAADYTFQFGNAGWKPITGDWDGHDDGNPATTIGVYNPNTATYYLNNENDSSAAESTIQYGNLGWTPIAADWDGNSFSSIGAYDPNTSTFYLRNANSPGPADITVQYGNVGWKPIAGDWDGQ